MKSGALKDEQALINPIPEAILEEGAVLSDFESWLIGPSSIDGVSPSTSIIANFFTWARLL